MRFERFTSVRWINAQSHEPGPPVEIAVEHVVAFMPDARTGGTTVLTAAGGLTYSVAESYEVVGEKLRGGGLREHPSRMPTHPDGPARRT